MDHPTISDHINIPQTDLNQTFEHQAFVYRSSRRRVSWPLRLKTKKNRKKVTTVRLGGNKRQLLVRAFERIRVRWVRMKAACMFKKLKEYYCCVLKEVMEAGGSFQTFQQRVMLEASFAVPVMGLALNAHRSYV